MLRAILIRKIKYKMGITNFIRIQKSAKTMLE